jgi:hypothetical protein
MEWHIKRNRCTLFACCLLIVQWLEYNGVCVHGMEACSTRGSWAVSFMFWEYNLQYPFNARSVGSRPSLSTLKNTVTFSCQEPNYQSLVVQPGAHSWLFPCGTIKKALYLLQYIICVKYCSDKEWLFHNTNVQSLLAKLTPEDCDIFSFDIKQLNWNKYRGNCVKGVRQYALKDDWLKLGAGPHSPAAPRPY